MSAPRSSSLHDWDQFITPAELRAALARHGLHPHGMAGMSPGISPPALIRAMRQLKKGRFSYAEFGRKTSFALGQDLRILYIGHATKPTGPAVRPDPESASAGMSASKAL